MRLSSLKVNECEVVYLCYHLFIYFFIYFFFSPDHCHQGCDITLSKNSSALCILVITHKHKIWDIHRFASLLRWLTAVVSACSSSSSTQAAAPSLTHSHSTAAAWGAPETLASLSVCPLNSIAALCVLLSLSALAACCPVLLSVSKHGTCSPLQLSFIWSELHIARKHP